MLQLLPVPSLHPAPGCARKSPHGVCLDSQQRVWAICYRPAQDGKYYAMRIDTTQGVDPSTGNIVGKVVEAVDLGGFPPDDAEYHGPYNYSDMSGFVALSATQPAGVWDFVANSGADYTLWHSATLDTTLNGGDLAVEVRAADRITDLPSWSFRRLAGSGGTLPFGTPALKGRYLEVRVNLLRSFGAPSSPVLKKLSLAWGAAGTDLQITTHPKSQVVAVDGAAEFTVTATGVGLSYEWFKDGTPVGTGPLLTVNNVVYTNAGKYKVRVTDATGAYLDSAEARLHVASPDQNPPWTLVDNAQPVLGQPVVFTAQMSVWPPGGPVYYQWRKNGVPIPGASGLCVTSDNQNYAATNLISSVACLDTGSYSAVFTNGYWKMVSEERPIVVYGQNNQPLPILTVTTSGVPILDRNSPPTLTAVTCFTAACYQWYKMDATVGWQAIPNATANQYTFPTPVPCEMVQGLNYYMVEVFDEGRIPHTSDAVQVHGDCQP